MILESAKDVHKLFDGKRLLIFDFDGTLADTSPLHEASFNAVLAPWGIKCDYPSIAGLRTRDALSACFAAASICVAESELSELTLFKQATVRVLIQETLKPLPGVDRFLHWARSRYQLALYSSGSRGTVSLAIKKLGYAGWFDPVLCAEDVALAKPHPEGYLKVLKITQIDSSQAIIFEDSDAGSISASAANVECVRVSKETFENIGIWKE